MAFKCELSQSSNKRVLISSQLTEVALDTQLTIKSSLKLITNEFKINSRIVDDF